MAKAKCKICGAELDTKTSYKVTDKNGKNKYFCSASEFEAEEERKKKAQEDRDRVYYLICDIMGEKEIISTALFKEWQIWNKVADNAKIAKYLVENKDYLTSVIARLQTSEYARIRYLSAIIRDKIKAFVPKVEVKEVPRVVVEQVMYDATPSNTRSRRRGLADLEDDII
jgi:YHS domain-containing protein